MSETAIRVQNVTKLYKLYDKPSDRFRESLGLTKKVLHREHYALHDLNFDIKKGECVGIIGTNGSGKSTLMRTLLHLQQPVSGTILLGDGLQSNEIGYLPQQTAVQKDFPF